MAIRFNFGWRRKGATSWITKHIDAADHAQAVNKLVKHLQKKISADLTEIEVDHYFHREKDGEKNTLYTLLKMDTPLTVVFCNKPWQPGQYPEYPNSNWNVAN